MAAASNPPKEPDRAAAEKKMAYRTGIKDIAFWKTRGFTYSANAELGSLVPT